MRQVAIETETDWDGWRRAARMLVLAGVEPGEVVWRVGGATQALPEVGGSFTVSRTLVSLASVAIQARHPERFGLLYGLVWRANAGEAVMEDEADPDVVLAKRLALSVRADAHRMRALLRFMAVPDGSKGRYLGWYEPRHFVLPANAQLLARRFDHRIFSIVTPDGAAHWDGAVLKFGSGLGQAGDDETLRTWWDQYGERLLDEAKGGCSVPEAESLSEAIRPLERASLAPVVIQNTRDPELVKAGQRALTCDLCPLHFNATQTVFGEGPSDARVMFVGEQPGDQEDVIGRPFVGPAGQMMDRALEEAGIDRRLAYVTNAVKHFKFLGRGKRRVHQTPEVPEITACSFWLDIERAHVRPALLVLMGASAARSVLKRAVTISRERGRPMALPDGQMAFVTIHPSYLLRLPDAAAKEREYAAFVRDLIAVKDLVSRAG